MCSDVLRTYIVPWAGSLFLAWEESPSTNIFTYYSRKVCLYAAKKQKKFLTVSQLIVADSTLKDKDRFDEKKTPAEMAGVCV
jgi:hypothetical protein